MRVRNKKKLKTPVIFLTAKNTENDKLTGFSLGADDYITKPFSVRELMARVKAVMRRPNPQEMKEPVKIKIAGPGTRPGKEEAFHGRCQG